MVITDFHIKPTPVSIVAGTISPVIVVAFFKALVLKSKKEATPFPNSSARTTSELVSLVTERSALEKATHLPRVLIQCRN